MLADEVILECSFIVWHSICLGIPGLTQVTPGICQSVPGALSLQGYRHSSQRQLETSMGRVKYVGIRVHKCTDSEL